MCKASIAAVVLALGIVSLVQEGTNAMVGLPAGLLIAEIKANPGYYSFASAGVGTTPHLSGELFKISQGLDLVHVPFNGSVPAIQSALAGHTPIAFTVLTPVVPQAKEAASVGGDDAETIVRLA